MVRVLGALQVLGAVVAGRKASTRITNTRERVNLVAG